MHDGMPETGLIRELNGLLNEIYESTKSFRKSLKNGDLSALTKEEMPGIVEELVYFCEKNKYTKNSALLLGIGTTVAKKARNFYSACISFADDAIKCKDFDKQKFANETVGVFDAFLDEVLKAMAVTKDLLDSGSPVSSEKPPKVFISHSSKDKEVADQLVTLLEGMGLEQSQIFCSSIPGYGVPAGKLLGEFLRDEFLTHEVYVIFLHSEHYYNSSFSLNEMGAAWVLKNDYISFFLPGFKLGSMKGVVTPDTIAIKLD